jgi:hypothetical protein
MLMKKLLLLAILAASFIVFTQCRSGRSSAARNKLDYSIDIEPIMATKCTPCHFPDKGGKVEALNNYTAVKNHIDDIIRRIQLNPGERGYMPFKKPKLSDSTIQIFKQWKDDGMIE